ncbi:MAG: antibiotic biosynthesis monooxygenase [Geminicoccaceae bacterium]
MFARMAYWNCKQDCWGEDMKLFEQGAVPIMRGHEGFVRAMLLGTPGETRRIAFTVWRDRDAYAAFVASSDLEKITRMFAHMYVEGDRPEPVEYEVRAEGAAA